MTMSDAGNSTLVGTGALVSVASALGFGSVTQHHFHIRPDISWPSGSTESFNEVKHGQTLSISSALDVLRSTSIPQKYIFAVANAIPAGTDIVSSCKKVEPILSDGLHVMDQV
jgi:uncharacterized NAD-dependent epimerase/dehydratase family protein